MSIAVPASFDLHAHTGLVRRGLHEQRRFILPTGIAPLDACLPDGGLPRGHVTEITGRRASGKLSLALATTAHVLDRGEAAALVDPAATTCPAVLEHPVLERLLVVRGGGHDNALKAADALLGTAAFALLVLDWPGRTAARTAALLRLEREVRGRGTCLLLLSESLPWRPDGLASLVSLRLAVRPWPRPPSTVEVSLVKSKLGGEGRRVRLRRAALWPANGARPVEVAGG